MSSVSTGTSSSSTSSSSGAFVATDQIDPAIREAHTWDISYYRIEKEDNFSLKLMAYATGAPKRSFWVRRKVRRDSGYAFRLSREDKAVSWVNRHIELGWVKVDEQWEGRGGRPAHPPSANPTQPGDGGGGGGGGRPSLGGPANPNLNPMPPAPPPAGAAGVPRVAFAAVPGGAVPVYGYVPATGVQPPRPPA